MLRLGLTGGIGSGKSTVASMLERHGAHVLDADVIARSCTGPGGLAIPGILSAFGREFIGVDGSMDRQKMREHAFAHPEARKVLEAIIHPLVKDQMERLASLSHAPCVLMDIPLLAESTHWRPRLDRILVVDCSTDCQVQRVMDRSGWSRELSLQVIAQQATRPQRLAIADMVISNEGLSLSELQCSVSRLAAYLGL